VQLSETDIVEPDIVVVLESRMAIVERKKIVGAPDLVIEILSESSEERDRTLKRDLYEQSGVREYWIVDPAERSVRQLVLTAGRYVDQGDSSTRVNSAALEGVSVDLTEVW
jgi:Uma2 family endonuclease